MVRRATGQELFTCPHCGKRFRKKDTPIMPFCSRQCRLMDLGRWIKEDYCVPEDRPLDEEEYEF